MTPEASTVQLPAVGVRTVAGAIGACALMLLACSWFVFAGDRGEPGVDVGAPAPVRIDDTARDVGAHTRPSSPPIRVRHARIAHARVVKPAARRAPTPAAPATTPAPQPAPAPQAAPTQDPAPAPPTVPALPVTTPMVVPSVTLSLPQVTTVPLPAVTVTTPELGLP